MIPITKPSLIVPGRVARRHSLPRGLQRSAVFLDNGFRELFTGGVPSNVGGNTLFRNSMFGPVLDLSNGGNTATVGYQVDIPTQISLEYLFITKAGANPGIVCIGTWDQASNGSSTTSDRTIYIDGSFHLNWYIFDGASKLITDTAVVAEGALYHVVGTSDGVHTRLYINGVESPSSPLAAGTAFTGYSSPVFWVIGSGNIGPLSGQVPCIHAFLLANYANVAWSAEEVRERYLDPFGFLKRQAKIARIAGVAALPSWTVSYEF